MKTDFEKYAIANGIGSINLHRYNNAVANRIKNGYISPTILEERELNVVGYDVFSRLMVDRIIFLGTDVNEDSANIINSQLMYLNSIDDGQDIKLFINTPGGSVIDGLAVYDVMNFVNPDVATYCMGMCASMGSVLLSSGAKGKRYSLPNGEVMIHQVSSGVSGQNSDIQIRAKHTQRLQNKLYEILAENTGKTFEDIERDADRDNWFTASDAKEYGLIDEIIFKKSKN